jgi:transposase-like protein
MPATPFYYVVSKRQNTPHLKYDQQDRREGVEAVLEGSLSQSQASKGFNIPKSTLGDDIKRAQSGRPPAPRPGRKPALPESDELALVCWIVLLARAGVSPTARSVRARAREIGRIRNIKQFVASPKWFKGFKKRHPKLLHRRALKLSAAHASISRAQLDQWYDQLRKLIEDHHITVDMIFNLDDTGIDRPGGKAKVVFPAGELGSAILDDFRDHVSILSAVGADGKRFPPTYIFPAATDISVRNLLKGDAVQGSQQVNTRKLPPLKFRSHH